MGRLKGARGLQMKADTPRAARASLLPPEPATCRESERASLRPGKVPSASCSSVKWDNLTPPASAARRTQTKTSALAFSPAVLELGPSVATAHP